jgi:hypothetical protein
MRVVFVDQVDLPGPVPVFKLLFAQDRRLHLAKQLKMHETIDCIFGCMSGRRIVTMLPHAANKVGRHANIQRAIKLARKDIDAGLFFLSHGRSLAAKWTLKQVQGDDFFEGRISRQRHPELVSGSIGKLAQVYRLFTNGKAQ